MVRRAIRPILDIGTPVEVEVTVLEIVILASGTGRDAGHVGELTERARGEVVARAGSPAFGGRVLADSGGGIAGTLADLPWAFGAADARLCGVRVIERLAIRVAGCVGVGVGDRGAGLEVPHLLLHQHPAL